MLYSAWDREINISLFFCDVFVWKWGPRLQKSNCCYHGNKSAATFKRAFLCIPPWVPNCMPNLKGGWKSSFRKMFDSYRDLFLGLFFFSALSKTRLGGRHDKLVSTLCFTQCDPPPLKKILATPWRGPQSFQKSIFAVKFHQASHLTESVSAVLDWILHLTWRVSCIPMVLYVTSVSSCVN